MIVYKDKVQLVNVATDGYDDKVIDLNETVKSLFHQGTGYTSDPNADHYMADAHVYLNPKDPNVLNNVYRLEGWYIVANIFGGGTEDAWYRIERVVVGQRKLLANNVDNVHCFLKKVKQIAPLPGES